MRNPQIRRWLSRALSSSAHQSFARPRPLPFRATFPEGYFGGEVAMASDDRDGAFARLSVALDEQSKMTAARGTDKDLHSRAHLRAAAQQVAAREAWVAWMERESWR